MYLSPSGSCQKKFKVKLNFRQFYRKTVDLVGEVINLYTDLNKWLTITIINISMSGLRFKVIGPNDIKEGHRLRVNSPLTINNLTK